MIQEPAAPTARLETPSQRLKREWFPDVRADLLSGTVVALALIPEAVAFSIIAGVDPKVGLYASFIIAVLTGIFGGRTGMISAATAAMAVLFVTLVKNHGIEYLFAATILTGILQFAIGAAGFGRFMRFVPRAVMVGFVNALAILIFLAQLPQFEGANWVMFAMVAASLGIIYGLPRITKAVPSALVAIIVMTIAAIALKLPLRIVGDMGALPSTLPFFALPQVPLSFETLQIIFPYALGLATVGILESLLTASLLDDLTETPSDKNRECKAQGFANLVTGFFGGMAGCAMIGQSVINFRSGGRGRLSSFAAGAFLLFFILVLGEWVRQIPMAALVAVMFMVSIGTFDWASFKSLQFHPRGESVVMVATVVAVVYTHNLAIGVGVGILLSALFFVRKVAKMVSVSSSFDEATQTRVYTIWGQLFFVSTDEFLASFDFEERIEHVKIDLTHAHLWDSSAVAAIDKVVFRLRRSGHEVELLGLNHASATIIDRLALHDKEGAIEAEFTH
ncbi:MAG: SulP family inorganic anion transporter [Armatimonadetes bacterium]|nr:SulP family inorganic anion transporter [Armatimonadota bacterium]